MKRNLSSLALPWLGVVCFLLALACAPQAEAPRPALTELRQTAAKSKDPDAVASWLLAELLRPGGSPDLAKKARRHLDEIDRSKGPAPVSEGEFEGSTMIAALSRAMDDFAHGRVRRANGEFFRALELARTSSDPRAPLVAWYAALHVQDLSRHVLGFGRSHRDDVDLLLREPGSIGFRAYAVVVDLWAREAFASAEKGVDEKLADKLGCAKEIAIAGPFGEGVASDILRPFPAEDPGPWPRLFPPGKRSRAPRQLEVERVGCDVEARETPANGIFYGQTYVTLVESTELIFTATGATAIWIDDRKVLDRDPRTWGVWPRFGVQLRLGSGRHRVLWKMGDASTTLRIMHPDGRPYPAKTSTDGQAGYALDAPQVKTDPNAVMAFIEPSGVRDPGDDLTRYLAAYLSDREGQPDVATVLLEPLVKDPARATGLSLITASGFVQGDLIYDQNQTRELVHELEVRSVERDRELWYPRMKGALWEAEQRGPAEAVTELARLVKQFPEVAALHSALARIYERLGWAPELERTVEGLVRQFSGDPSALKLGIDLYEARGDSAKADELLRRLAEIDPDSELFLERALVRRDYQLAIAELKRLAARRPSREDLALRIEDVMVRAGNDESAWKRLEAAILREPRDVHSRLALADARLAQGDQAALAKALVSAVEAGADPSVIEEAIDLVEGITELEPYRKDAKAVIAEFEKANGEHPGTAVRVLDYGAVLVRSDGSSRFLEHELVRVQSEEGIKRFTEMDTGGYMLHLRVIKKDGRILEPEQVAGKPTATMPHLEIGDYVEQERIISRWAEGEELEYEGPTWFFREEDIAYARSEFVVIAPASKNLQLEKTSGVPEPTIQRQGAQVIYRFRVDDSPAAPTEPNSPPVQEFLPRVSLGWGLSLSERLKSTSRSLVSMTPVDPRIARIAKNIVKGKDKSELSQARALYHWVLDSVQEGDETDGRRVVVGRSGNRWRALVTLCEALGIPVRWALAESRIASPVVGEIGAANRSLSPLLLVGRGPDAIWLTIADKFAPYGTVPGHLRGERAYLLGGFEVEESRVPQEGTVDRIAYEGTGKLRADGSARLSLRIVFSGQYAAGMRNGLSRISETQLGPIIESQLLGQKLPGAELLGYEVHDQDHLDRALVLEVAVEVPHFATPSSGSLLLGPPFMPQLSNMTRLATRKTPLLISDTTGQGLDLRLELPEGAKASVRQVAGSHARARYDVRDKAGPGYLHLVRDVVTDAGRVPPDGYPELQSFVREADAALTASLRIFSGPGQPPAASPGG